MKMRQIAAAALLTAIGVPAMAAQFDFYKLGRGAINGDFLPSDGVTCTGGDLCSSNVGGGVFNGDLTFSSGGITVHATGKVGPIAAAVVQDSEPNWSASTGAGLGVYHVKPVDNSDDNITAFETLTLTFEQAVTITGLGLRSEGHNFTNWAAGSAFEFDGVSTMLPIGTGSITGLSKTGTVFTFAYGDGGLRGRHADQFYLSSVTVTAVPEPETYALMLAGLGAIGAVARRRKRA